MCCKLDCVLSVWWVAEEGCYAILYQFLLRQRLKKCGIFLIKFLLETNNQAIL